MIVRVDMFMLQHIPRGAPCPASQPPPATGHTSRADPTAEDAPRDFDPQHVHIII